MWIRGVRILDPSSSTDVIGDMHIENGHIAGIYPGGTKLSDQDIIAAQGLWVMPGLIDMHVHLRDPGFEYKEDIHTGSLAAAAGGVTTVVAMANTNPVNDNPSVTEYILEKARITGLIRVLTSGAVTKGQEGKELSEMGLMQKAGIVAVSDDGRPIESAAMMRRALEYAATFGLPLIAHCQDKTLSGKGVMHEGTLSSFLGLQGIPRLAEDVMVARDIAICEDMRIPLHITHVSTKGSLALIGQAKARGIPVTCDVTPHNFLLTEERLKTYDTNAKMFPPLREESDRQALIEGLRTGVIDSIASDHAPHAFDEKDLDFDLAPFGTIGLQTLLPALLKLHYEYDLDLLKLIACVTTNPARILGIDGGSLASGSRADIAIVDPTTTWTLTEDMIVSKSKNSAFLGENFTGKVVYTIVEGRIVYKS
jgi:dihydroorotase